MNPPLKRVSIPIIQTYRVEIGEAASQAAVHVARDLGLEVDTPVMLRSTNNVVAWLHPAPVVAKIAREGGVLLQWEQDVAAVVSQHGGPIVGPSGLVSPIVHAWAGWEMTFWTYHHQDGTQAAGPEVGVAMDALHTALGQTAAELHLPDWDQAPKDVLRRLDDASFAEQLRGADRDLVRTTLARLDDIPEVTARVCALHGSPHNFNILLVEGEVRFIDLETVCVGPVEWDLFYLEPSAVSAYVPGHSPTALNLARRVVSAMVSALCFEGIDRGPDMRHHAMHHLDALRSEAG